jgi:GMP synthase-like glutamine amidotransferase
MLTVIQNDPDVPLGSYGHYLETFGVKSRMIRPYAAELIPAPGSCSAVIVLGGAMGVHDVEKYPFLSDVKSFISDCVNLKIPFLGICLGGQLLAEVLGATVSSGIHPERGVLPVNLTVQGFSDPIFSGISNPFISFQWHNDSFELPQGAIHLASSPACPFQAFRMGNAWGVQFHPEVNQVIVANWCRCIAENPPLSPEESDVLIGDFKVNNGEYSKASSRIVENFLRIDGIT